MQKTTQDFPFRTTTNQEEFMDEEFLTEKMKAAMPSIQAGIDQMSAHVQAITEEESLPAILRLSLEAESALDQGMEAVKIFLQEMKDAGVSDQQMPDTVKQGIIEVLSIVNRVGARCTNLIQHLMITHHMGVVIAADATITDEQAHITQIINEMRAASETTFEVLK